MSRVRRLRRREVLDAIVDIAFTLLVIEGVIVLGIEIALELLK